MLRFGAAIVVKAVPKAMARTDCTVRAVGISILKKRSTASIITGVKALKKGAVKKRAVM